MATSNFYTQKSFALVVWNINTVDTSGYDDDINIEDIYALEEEYAIELAEDFIRELNSDLLFHKVGLRSGYYSSFQFYVESTLALGYETEEVEYLDNEDCQMYYDMNRSTLLRKHKAEVNKINKSLRKFAKDCGNFVEIGVYARFSNGETMYQIVGV